MKICSKCGIKKDNNCFSKQPKSKDGLEYKCKQCCNLNNKMWKQNNPVKVKEDNKINYDLLRINDPEKFKKYNKDYYLKNSNKISTKSKIKRLNRSNEDKEKSRISKLKWARENPDKTNAVAAKRRATKLNATLNLPDQNALISEFYKESIRLTKETGIQHHVDHIVPLQGKTVSGLHVPWNLQVITRDENLKKSNKLLVE